MNQPDIQKHLNAQVARLVMELATAHAVIEHQESQIADLSAKSTRETDAPVQAIVSPLVGSETADART